MMNGLELVDERVYQKSKTVEGLGLRHFVNLKFAHTEVYFYQASPQKIIQIKSRLIQK